MQQSHKETVCNIQTEMASHVKNLGVERPADMASLLTEQLDIYYTKSYPLPSPFFLPIFAPRMPQNCRSVSCAAIALKIKALADLF